MPETSFFWDPLSDNILQERDETGAVTAEYTTEPELYGNLICQNRGGVESQYHFDALGSTLARTNEGQQIIDAYGYTSFGETSERTGSTESPFGFMAQHEYYFDELVTDYVVRQRTLSFASGRWLSVDPEIPAMDYRYAINNPLRFADPSGLVYVDKAPASETGAPWCKVGRNAPRMTVDPVGRPITVPADPKGLPEQDFGRTVPILLDVDCGCVCSNAVTGSYMLGCILWAHLQIRIAEVNFTQRANLRNVYAHEQRHVRNLLQAADTLAGQIAPHEAASYSSYGDCLARKHAVESYVKDQLAAAIEAEETHLWQDPVAGSLQYSIIGGKMPATPKCAMPTPSTSIDDRLCCHVYLPRGANPVE
jgi:RHS repeat-associated protein